MTPAVTTRPRSKVRNPADIARHDERSTEIEGAMVDRRMAGEPTDDLRSELARIRAERTADVGALALIRDARIPRAERAVHAAEMAHARRELEEECTAIRELATSVSEAIDTLELKLEPLRTRLQFGLRSAAARLGLEIPRRLQDGRALGWRLNGLLSHAGFDVPYIDGKLRRLSLTDSFIRPLEGVELNAVAVCERAERAVDE